MSLGLLVVQIVARVTCYLPPVEAPIVEPFDAPACTYCPGHRGVEYDVAPGTPVRAAASGVVTFNGVVAGTRYLVVLGDDGLSATYGMLASAGSAVGQRVTTGGTIASAGTRLYFGLRDGEVYLDPADYLGVVHHRARLVPSSGRPGRPARAMPPTCPAATSGR
jgi:murein DD-endopeptidase MepM/ murein hydrolase activator NlpD